MNVSWVKMRAHILAYTAIYLKWWLTLDSTSQTNPRLPLQASSRTSCRSTPVQTNWRSTLSAGRDQKSIQSSLTQDSHDQPGSDVLPLVVYEVACQVVGRHASGAGSHGNLVARYLLSVTEQQRCHGKAEAHLRRGGGGVWCGSVRVRLSAWGAKGA